MAWKQKLKSLFITDGSAQPKPQAPPLPDPLEDPSLVAHEPTTEELLASYELPKGESVSLPDGTDNAGLVAPIDFQGLYDQAGIPNTDEVEMLEKFLGGLDGNLPQTSKIAAAKAFLGAIGKSTNDVFNDAARKIKVVRAVDEAKSADVEITILTNQQEIDKLQQQIDQHRATMEAARKNLESVKIQCTAEEARLQAARIFFGHMEKMAEKAEKKPG